MGSNFKQKIDLLLSYPFFRDLLESYNVDMKKFQKDLNLFSHDLLQKGLTNEDLRLIERLSPLLAKLPKGRRYNDLINGKSSDFLIFEVRGKLISIEPLSYSTLKGAIELVRKFFGKEPDYRVFPVSLILEKGGVKAFVYKRILQYGMGIIELHYWISMDVYSNKVVGITGVYCYAKDQHEADWGGWTCVDENYRRYYGIGLRLGNFVLNKAKQRGKKYFRLYTSTSPSEATANKIYQRYNFRIFKREPIKGTSLEYLYMEKELY